MSKGPTHGTGGKTPSKPYHMQVGGDYAGRVIDIEVDLHTGDIIQENASSAAALNLALANQGKTGQASASDIEQLNAVFLSGDVKLSFHIKGDFTGLIRGVDVGLLTGDVFQANFAKQVAVNAAVDNDGRTHQTIGQSGLQSNTIEVIGDVSVRFVSHGDFHGKVRDFEVGLVTGDVVQQNTLTQLAKNIAFENVGGTAQTISQTALQKNVLQVIGDVKVHLIFQGDFDGEISDVSIGVIVADIVQSNDTLAIGLNVAAANDGSVSQKVSQFSSQGAWVDAEGDLNVKLKVEDGFDDKIRGLQVGILVDNVVHAPADAVW